MKCLSLGVLKQFIFVMSLLNATVLSLGVPSALAQTTRLQDASYLRKLSFHVRGLPPVVSEYQELKLAQASGSVDDFFQKKISDYLSSPQHARKMSFRLEELFRLRTNSRPEPLPSSSSSPAIPHGERNALNDLFMRMASGNLSWDTLLTGKSYRLYPLFSSDFGVLGDRVFLRALASTQMPPVEQDQVSSESQMVPFDLSFDLSDKRLAGALTTARFFSRYTTTQLNKNRRRAAAVFNIFLCDAMSAVVPPPPANPDDLLDKAFPKTSTITEEEIKTIATRPDKHGAEQACAQCHYKLDPMGQIFATSNLILAPKASPGRLVFRDQKRGQLVDRSVQGLGELGQAITEQPAYVDCQIEHFWNWFIGEDRPLSEERKQELAREFDRVGRRTNEFISVLLKSSEFRTIDRRTPEQIRVAGIKGIFKKCMDCHDVTETDDFTAWPIGGNKQTMQYWIKRIGKRLDLGGDGSKRDMPPIWSGWQPSTTELEALKSWIGDGAPDENGVPQI